VPNGIRIALGHQPLQDLTVEIRSHLPGLRIGHPGRTAPRESISHIMRPLRKLGRAPYENKHDIRHARVRIFRLELRIECGEEYGEGLARLQLEFGVKYHHSILPESGRAGVSFPVIRLDLATASNPAMAPTHKSVID